MFEPEVDDEQADDYLNDSTRTVRFIDNPGVRLLVPLWQLPPHAKGLECTCCHEMDVLNPKLDSGILCVTDHDDFSIVFLQPAVLRTAMRAMHEIGYSGIPDTVSNR